MALTAVGAPKVVPRAEGSLHALARQPILDARGVVQAYALMFRGGPERVLQDEPERAIGTLVDQSLMHGFRRFTRGLPAFVCCTSESLAGGIATLMDPKATIIEIQESSQPVQELMATCHLLKAAGFRLSFSNFCWERRYEDLQELADFVRVDCALVRKLGLGQSRHSTRHEGICWVAKNVETLEDFRQVQKEGFTRFQGFYFCHPELLRSHAVPPNRLSQLKVLQYLQNPTLDMRRLGALVMQDVGLTFRLLRLVNSPMYPVRHEIGSVEAALMVVGEEAFRRVVMMVVVSELNAGGSAELLRLALTRARFCERTAPLFGLDPQEEYLLGMLSLLPAMLRITMETIVRELPLRLDIRKALLGAANAPRQPLLWIEVYERGQWIMSAAAARDAGVDEAPLMDAYLEAVWWAETAANFVH